MLLKLKRSLCLFLPRKSLKERKEDEIVYAIIAKENKDPAMISPLEVPQEVTKLPFDFEIAYNSGMAGKKGDGCINLMEERMHSVQEDIIIVKESMTKIPFLEMSMTAIMERLDAMAMEIQENLERLSSNKRRKPKNSNDGFRVGLPKPPLVAEGNRAREVCDNGNKGEIRTRRVEMPNFYGKDPEEWLYCAERFFSLNQMSDTEKLAAVVVSMDGEAFAWHQWEDTNRVAKDPSKIEAMQRWPTPRYLEELRDFLAEHAFNQLKHAMTTIPVLALPNFNKPFVIETNASGVGVGVVLMQDQRPIAYYNHILPQRNILKRFVVRIDQRSLKYLLKQRLISEGHQKWLTELLGYTFEIQYRLKLENRATDVLSQYPELTALTLSPVVNFEEIQKEVETDKALNHIRMEVLEGNPKYSGYAVVQG
ncbi:hypothetical protein CK203_028339 [Vitis vinifera]|uniref:Reverse transcriptase/retrotransposon-derived protein RNase H-like domain-containing protein n=1 Tax=Vitis vinifera TaxID=29760 RepID=A0A438J064_VITVI|nr:hypothetical protein CK203_028339 [Vitis vinifera]